LAGSHANRPHSGPAPGAAVRTRLAAAGEVFGGDALGLAVIAMRYARVTGDRSFVGLAYRQADRVLGANPWGVSWVVGAGTTFPRCPHHQVANLTGGLLEGAVVNGPTEADELDDLSTPSGARPCATAGLDDYDGQGLRFVDDVAAWPTVEPSIDLTATGLLAFTLLGG
jgi:endoglucanase